MQEKRFFHASISLRGSQGDEGAIMGYASKFNTLSTDLGGFKERLMPGCFSRSLNSGRDIHMYFGHDVNRILGRTKNGTLHLAEDNEGLNFRCVPPNTTDGRDAKELVRTGTMDEMSFGFSCDEDGQDWDANGVDDDGNRCLIRSIRTLTLYEISMVSRPAYEHGTSAKMAHPAATSVYAKQPAMAMRSMTELFPQGLPAEIRARVNDVREITNRRRSFQRLILSI